MHAPDKYSSFQWSFYSRWFLYMRQIETNIISPFKQSRQMDNSHGVPYYHVADHILAFQRKYLKPRRLEIYYQNAWGRLILKSRRKFSILLRLLIFRKELPSNASKIYRKAGRISSNKATCKTGLKIDGNTNSERSMESKKDPRVYRYV